MGYAPGSAGIPGLSSVMLHCRRFARFSTTEEARIAGGVVKREDTLLRRRPNVLSSEVEDDEISVSSLKLNILSSARPNFLHIRFVRGVMLSGKYVFGRSGTNLSTYRSMNIGP